MTRTPGSPLASRARPGTAPGTPSAPRAGGAELLCGDDQAAGITRAGREAGGREYGADLAALGGLRCSPPTTADGRKPASTRSRSVVRATRPIPGLPAELGRRDSRATGSVRARGTTTRSPTWRTCEQSLDPDFCPWVPASASLCLAEAFIDRGPERRDCSSTRPRPSCGDGRRRPGFFAGPPRSRPELRARSSVEPISRAELRVLELLPTHLTAAEIRRAACSSQTRWGATSRRSTGSWAPAADPRWWSRVRAGDCSPHGRPAFLPSASIVGELRPGVESEALVDAHQPIDQAAFVTGHVDTPARTDSDSAEPPVGHAARSRRTVRAGPTPPDSSLPSRDRCASGAAPPPPRRATTHRGRRRGGPSAPASAARDEPRRLQRHGVRDQLPHDSAAPVGHPQVIVRGGKAGRHEQAAGDEASRAAGVLPEHLPACTQGRDHQGHPRTRSCSVAPAGRTTRRPRHCRSGPRPARSCPSRRPGRGSARGGRR